MVLLALVLRLFVPKKQEVFISVNSVLVHAAAKNGRRRCSQVAIRRSSEQRPAGVDLLQVPPGDKAVPSEL